MSHKYKIKKRRVLVIDDNPNDVGLIYTMTSQLGFDVTMCFDGEWALKYALKKHFDLVIVDLNMPIMGGIQFLRLADLFIQHDMPVIIYSGCHVIEDELAGFQRINIIDVWEKPMSPMNMLRRMKSYESYFKAAA